MRFLIFLLLFSCCPVWALTITEEEAQAAGKRIWQNECGGRVDGLTSWNVGEEFPSLGIGHFIWYPTGTTGRFQESFPALVTYLGEQGVKLPAWLKDAKGCPWPSREAFLADFSGERLKGLRQLLASTVAHQARFIVLRMEAALPKMLEAVPAAERPKVKARFETMAAAPNGVYALVDYVNFKGEGVNPKERYKGQGWGLLQVLQEMPGDVTGRAASRAFAAAADRVLTRRVQNSPPERGESRWMVGWRNRCQTYGD